jgi:hypothetical protein
MGSPVAPGTSACLDFRARPQPSPTLGDVLNAGYLYLEVKCLGCNTHQTVALNIVRRPKTTPIHEWNATCAAKTLGSSRLSVQAQPSGRAATERDFSERSAIYVVAGREVKLMWVISRSQQCSTVR